jgi:hypothetical protein
VAHLSIADRAAIQPDLIQRLSAYPTGQASALEDWRVSKGHPSDQPLAFGDWPPESWPFFHLVASLDMEFSWREQDRVIHETLARSEADRFMSLIAWSHEVTDAGSCDPTASAQRRLPQIRAIDLYAFYDGGRDHFGLGAYHTMLGNPELWRSSDAATDLFFPLWNLRDGRYFKAILGLVGWISLTFAFTPWRSQAIAQALPWVIPEPESLLGFFMEIWPGYLGFWILFSTQKRNERYRFFAADSANSKAGGIPWDQQAALLFPFWAFGRGLYLRGIIGALAWIAIPYQMIAFPAALPSVPSDPRFIGAVGLIVMLHITAGGCGQRWVVYKLLRTIEAADRAGLHDAAARLRYIRQRRTQHPRIVRKAGRLRVGLIVWLLAMLVIGALTAHFR